MFYVVKLKSGEKELMKKEMQEIFKNEYESFIHTAAHDLDSPARKDFSIGRKAVVKGRKLR